MYYNSKSVYKAKKYKTDYNVTLRYHWVARYPNTDKIWSNSISISAQNSSIYRTTTCGSIREHLYVLT